ATSLVSVALPPDELVIVPVPLIPFRVVFDPMRSSVTAETGAAVVIAALARSRATRDPPERPRPDAAVPIANEATPATFRDATIVKSPLLRQCPLPDGVPKPVSGSKSSDTPCSCIRNNPVFVLLSQ